MKATDLYFNEFDPFAAEWLGNLFPGAEIDTRSITDVQAEEFVQFTRCHFFGGIGGWELALQLAGWPEDREVITGSCPCPPFSTASKKKSCPVCGGKPIPHPRKTGIFACVPCGHEWFADGRHLYPEFLRLIRQRLPATIFGEQVAGADGLIWLDGVAATLEELGYTFAAADLCAASIGQKAWFFVCLDGEWQWIELTIGPPHIRQRLGWVATLADAAKSRHPRTGERPATYKNRENSNSQRGFSLNESPDGGSFVSSADAQGVGRGQECSLSRGCDDGIAEAEFKQRSGSDGSTVPLSDAMYGGRNGRQSSPLPCGSGDTFETETGCSTGGIPHPSDLRGSEHGDESGRRKTQGPDHSSKRSRSGELGHNNFNGYQSRQFASTGNGYRSAVDADGGVDFWTDSRAISCTDKKSRRTGRGVFPLVNGIPREMGRGQPELAKLVRGARRNRTGRIKGYGNAIVPQLWAAFIRSFLEAEGDQPGTGGGVR